MKFNISSKQRIRYNYFIFSNRDKYSSRLLVIAEAKSNKLTSIILNRSDKEIIYLFKLAMFSDNWKNSVFSNKDL